MSFRLASANRRCSSLLSGSRPNPTEIFLQPFSMKFNTIRLRAEAGRELEHTRARAADEVQRLAQEAAEQIYVKDRRANQSANCVLNLREELRGTEEESIARGIHADRIRAEYLGCHAGYRAEQERRLQGRGIYDNAVNVKDHEFC